MNTSEESTVPGHHFLDYLSILIQWRRFIIFNVLVATALAVIVSFLLPQWYRATASILPPKEPDLLSSLTGTANLLRGLSPVRSLRGIGMSQGAYNYFAILKSRGAMEAVVRKFNLIEVYDVSDSSMEKAIKELSNNVTFETQEDDNITIEVMDKDPQRAAQMANYFVELLNTISTELGTTEARNNREFIQSRVEQTNADLRTAEDSLEAYQERSGMIILPEENSASIAPVAELYGMKARKEVELAILRRTTSAGNPMTRQLEVEVSELDKKIAKIPGIGVESLRLYRSVAIQQKILEFLVPLYEQARINEHKDVPVILVLDKAAVPERKARPQRLLIVLLTSSLILLLSIVLSMTMHGAIGRPGSDKMGSRLRNQLGRVAKFYRITL